MEDRISVCGTECSSCDFLLEQTCEGCSEIQGRVWWSSHIGAEVCPIYDCAVNRKGYDNCGECDDMPCELWRKTRDPDVSEKEHQMGIMERTSRLIRMKNKGH